MNVLQINTLDSKGGAAKVARQIHNHLKKNGHNSSMFVKIKESDDPNIHQLKDVGFIKSTSDFLENLTGKNLYDFLKYNHIKVTANDIEFFKENNIFDTKEYKEADIVHLHNLHGNYFPLKYLVRMSREKKLVWTLHDMWAMTGHACHTFCDDWQTGCQNCKQLDIYQELPWDNSFNLWKKKKQIYSQINVNIVLPCRWLETKAKQSILSQLSLHVIPNGVDTFFFKPEKNVKNIRETLRLPKDKKIALFVAYNGLENKWKGGPEVEKCIQKMTNNSNWHFVCVGMSKLTKNYPNLTLIPSIQSEHLIKQYYQASDVLLFPSIGETLPLTIMEAMSCGVFVIASDVGGINELVNSKTGRKISRADDLCGAIQTLDKLSLQKLNFYSQNARDHIKNNYSLKSMLDSYINLYSEII